LLSELTSFLCFYHKRKFHNILGVIAWFFGDIYSGFVSTYIAQQFGWQCKGYSWSTAVGDRCINGTILLCGAVDLRAYSYPDISLACNK